MYYYYQIGVNSCFIIEWGNGDEPIAFGLNDMCLESPMIFPQFYNSITVGESVVFENTETLNSFLFINWTYVSYHDSSNSFFTRERKFFSLLFVTNHTYYNEDQYQVSGLIEKENNSQRT